MKKILFISLFAIVVALSAIVFVACKKDVTQNNIVYKQDFQEVRAPGDGDLAAPYWI